MDEDTDKFSMSNYGRFPLGRGQIGRLGGINSRMTFFAETSESLIKSLSKKKIYFQYDQFSNSKISKLSLEVLERGLKEDPLSRKLLKLKHFEPETEVNSKKLSISSV